MIDYIIAFLKDIFCFKNRKIKNISIENAKKLEKVRKSICELDKKNNSLVHKCFFTEKLSRHPEKITRKSRIFYR